MQEGENVNYLMMVRREYVQMARVALVIGDVDRATMCLREVAKARRAYDILKEVLDGTIQPGN